MNDDNVVQIVQDQLGGGLPHVIDMIAVERIDEKGKSDRTSVTADIKIEPEKCGNKKGNEGDEGSKYETAQREFQVFIQDRLIFFCLKYDMKYGKQISKYIDDIEIVHEIETPRIKICEIELVPEYLFVHEMEG